MMNLTIVTVNFNGADRTIKLLKSLSSQTDRDFYTIVVDNASDEVDFRLLKETIGSQFSGVELVRNAQNLGFSGGNNVGIKMALDRAGGGSDWVFLLNNDTWVDEGFISQLKANLGQKRGILGVAIDEGDRVAYAGMILWLRSHGYHICNPDEAVNEVNKYIIGGAMAVHRDVFQKIGFMDDKYFLYFEDMDFSLRAIRAGFPINIVSGITVSHQPSSTTIKLGGPMLLRYHYRNALYFNWKNGPGYIKFANWLWSFWIIKKQIFKIMIRFRPDESHAILNSVFDFYRGKMGKIE
jgi:GT2 family glycosyltransferase